MAIPIEKSVIGPITDPILEYYPDDGNGNKVLWDRVIQKGIFLGQGNSRQLGKKWKQTTFQIRQGLERFSISPDYYLVEIEPEKFDQMFEASRKKYRAVNNFFKSIEKRCEIGRLPVYHTQNSRKGTYQISA